MMCTFFKILLHVKDTKNEVPELFIVNAFQRNSMEMTPDPNPFGFRKEEGR